MLAAPILLNEGSGMDNIKKLDPNPDRARIQRSEKSEGIIPIDLVHDHFQDYLKLLEKRKLKIMHTSSLDDNYGSISEVSSLKALMGNTFLAHKKTRDSSSLKLQAARKTDNFREYKTAEKEFQKNEGLGMKTISASKLKKILEAENSLVILDVREENELSGELGYFANSINIPLRSLRDRISELETMKDKEIMIVCRSGMRAVTAAKFLSREGFGNVEVLMGGMLAWRELEA
jgi:rhodanese-related sulfurtransferase